MLRRPAAWILISTALLTLALAAALAPAQETGARPSDAAQIETNLRLERKLLALDLAAYREARAVEQRTRTQVAEVIGRLDQALAGDSVALGNLEAVHLEVSSARAAAQIAADRVEWQLLRIEDRLRRIGFLEGETGRPATLVDPLSGRWRVIIRPQNQPGIFDLTLNGTLVTGTYRMTAGASGSFRGTYVNNRLRMERVDSIRGFDSVFQGALDQATGQLGGSWTANELAIGQPTQGDWTAVREGAPERQP